MAKNQKKQVSEVEVINVGQIATSGNEQNNETVEDRVQFEIGKFNFVDSEIAKMKEEFKDLEIKGLDDKEGIAKVADALKIVSSKRTGIESKRTELKDFYLNTGRGIDAEAKRIQALIAEVENPLKEKKNAIDLQIKKAKEEEEARLQKILDEKVETLKDAGIVFDGAFYSIGDSISVDLATINGLDEESFNKLLEAVKKAKEKIDEVENLKKLHERRKEVLLPYWSFLTSEMQLLDLSSISCERFDEINESVQLKKQKFDKIQADQEAEAEKQIKERKDLNFEKRSFRFEKIGFDLNEFGDVFFMNQSGHILVKKEQLENLPNEDFEKLFDEKSNLKISFEDSAKVADEAKKKKLQQDAEDKIQAEKDKAIEEKTNQRLLSIEKFGANENEEGEVFIGEKSFGFIDDLVALNDSEFLDITIEMQKSKSELEAENAKKEEDERLAKLPEIEKVKRYCEEILNIQSPSLNSEEAIKEFNLLFGEIKRSVEKTLSNLKTI